MSFNVFARGVNSFHFSKAGWVDGDDLDDIKTISQLQSMSPNTNGVIGYTVDHYGPSVDMGAGMGAQARLIFLHLLIDSVTLLATKGGGDDASISVSTIQNHMFGWPATVGYALYTIDSDSANPGVDFYKTIRGSLNDTGFNTWGALMALALVVSKYGDAIEDGVTPNLMIQLSK